MFWRTCKNETTGFEQAGRRLGRLVFPLVGVVSAMAVLGAIFWLLFYAVETANLSMVIPLRNWYQDTYWKVEGVFQRPVRRYPPFDPIYTILTQDSSNGYSYLFAGTFVKIDVPTMKVYLLGLDNREYAFTVTEKYMSTSRTLDSMLLPRPPAFGLIEVIWNDKRTLSQVMADYRKNPDAPLNSSGGNLYVSSDLSRPTGK